MKVSADHLALLEDFQTWNEGKRPEERISLLDYVSFNATAELVTGFAALFSCELIVVDGYHFIEERFDERSYAKWKQALTDMRDIQRAVNHLHIRVLLQNHPVDDALAVVCADAIASLWNEIHNAKGLRAEVHGCTFEDASVTLVALHE